MSSRPPEDLRNRLARWYAASRVPGWLGKVAQLDELLTSWSDDTAGLLQRMTEVHGPEPPPPAAGYAERAKAFLTRHAPLLVHRAEEELVLHRGREEEWYLRLKLEHGVDPALTYRGEMPGGWRVGDRVACRCPPVTGPERRGEVTAVDGAGRLCSVRWDDGGTTHGVVTALLEKAPFGTRLPMMSAEDSLHFRENDLQRREAMLAAREQRQLHQQSVSRSQQQLPSGTAAHDYLRQFYAHRNPTQLLILDDMLAEAGAGNEHKVVAALTALYGCDPHQPPGGRTAQSSLVSRLRRFYARHNPNHNINLHKVAAAYKGREEELFAALCAKYGVEEGDLHQVAAPPLSALPPPPLPENPRVLRGQRLRVLRAIAKSASESLLRAFYHRWLEFLWWGKNRSLMERVARETRGEMLKEQYEGQQLRMQIDLLKQELAEREELELVLRSIR